MPSLSAQASTLEHRYKARGACATVFKARDDEVLVAGPAGTGKSRACLEKVHMMALLNPGMRGLILRKAATTLSSTALVTWRKFVIPESLSVGDVEYYGGSAQEPPSYRYKNGSVVAIGGLDNVSKIMSAEYDIIYVQEATELTENEWESATTRLRNWQVSFQQILGDCNPQNPEHWLKTRCDKGLTRMLHSTHEDNPILFDEDGEITEQGESYIKKLDGLTGVRYQRLRLGKWVSAEGVIYEQYSSKIHVIERIEANTQNVDQNGIPYLWPRYWSVDFGYTNPFVLQCWAEDPQGRLFMYREIYMTHRTVDQHAKQLMRLITGPDGRWLEPKPQVVVCDHDAEGRAVLEAELELGTEPAHKSVLEGIEAVQRRLRWHNEDKAGEEPVQLPDTPQLFFLQNALVEKDPLLDEAKKPKCTIEEIPAYVWSEKPSAAQKEQPIKADDHGCDAMRYMVANRDFGVRVIYRTIDV
jgi:phage terminase large subunit